MISIGRVPVGVLAVTVWPTRSPSWRSTEPPSAIWPAVAGGRPVITVEDVIGPVPRARPIAGITVLPMVTVPCTPYVTSVMPGTCPVIWVNCFAVTVPNCPSNAMFQSWPYRRGVPTRRSRFAPNVPAAATAATATARPSMALRTGTLARPLPASSANRTPVTAASGAPTRDSPSASSGRRTDGSAAGRAPACRHAGTATRAASSTTMAAAPAARMPAFTLTPGCGSASRAGPIGVSGEAATAIATAPRAPATAAAAVSATLAVNSWRRVMPSAARVPLSCAAVCSVLAATWPTMSSAVSARASANSARAIACGRISRSTVAACVVSSAVSTWPPVLGYRLARFSAAALNVASDAPGSSVT